MITVITGPVDCGKTSEINKIFENSGGDGFISPKVYRDGVFVGYDLKHLATGETRALARIGKCSGFEGNLEYGRFLFSRGSFDYANSILIDMAKNSIKPIFIDEIGPVELFGGGFHNGIISAIEANVDLYLVIGYRCFREAVDKFHIGEYRILIPKRSCR